MKLKRFIAPDMRQALSLVRESLGSDAVILSNKKTDEGVEIVAAIDYDAPVERSKPTKPKISASASVTPIHQVSTQQRELQDTLRAKTKSTAPAAGQQTSDQFEQLQNEMLQLRRMMESGLSTLAWDKFSQQSPIEYYLFQQFMKLGVCGDIANQVVKQTGKIDDEHEAWHRSLYELASYLPVSDTDILDEGGIIAIVGPTGVGKTTTLAKIAARYCLKHGKQSLALVTTDSYRVGAKEQLSTYARILDIPLKTASTAEELDNVLAGLSNRHLVLIDTAGMSPRDVRLSEQLAVLKPGGQSVQTILALSATTQQQTAEQAIDAFASANPTACVVTKTDEAGSMGGILSALIRKQLPLSFITDGQRVPEDFHPARAHQFVQQASSLMESMQDVMSDQYMAIALGGARSHVNG